MAGWEQFMEKLAPEYRNWWTSVSASHELELCQLIYWRTSFLKEYDELVESSHGPGVKLGGYHLQVIGVSPHYQRKGVATSLMRYAESKVCYRNLHVRSCWR